MTTKTVLVRIVITIYFLFAVTLAVIVAMNCSAKVIVQTAEAVAKMAGLVFTVAGLWAGFVFPEAIKTIVSNASLKDKKEKFEEYKAILGPVSIALLCAIITTIIPVAYSIFQPIQALSSYKIILKIPSATAVVVMASLLGWSIFKIFMPSLKIFERLLSRVEDDEEGERHLPNSR